jgi:hypothetical protein
VAMSLGARVLALRGRRGRRDRVKHKM